LIDNHLKNKEKTILSSLGSSTPDMVQGLDIEQNDQKMDQKPLKFQYLPPFQLTDAAY
jgi:hypothetical protein